MGLVFVSRETRKHLNREVYEAKNRHDELEGRARWFENDGTFRLVSDGLESKEAAAAEALTDAKLARLDFIRANYEFPIPANLERFIAEHMAVHLDPTPDLRPRIRFGKDAVFMTDPRYLTRFAEKLVWDGFEALAGSGEEISASFGNTQLSIRFLKATDRVNGVRVGPTQVGDLTIIEVTATTATGAKAILGDSTIVVVPKDTPVLRVKRLSGGREEVMNVTNGKSEPTNKLYIIGGRYGDVGAEKGTYGLYNIEPGPYAPPMSYADYWASRAFVTGDVSIGVAADGKRFVIEGSNLHQIVKTGKVALPDGVGIRPRPAYPL